MSLSDRRSVLIGLAGLSLSACGFRPLYGEGSGSLVGRVSVQEAHDPESYAFRERMRRRIGHTADGAALGLGYLIEMEETPVAINPASDVTRYQVVARAEWRLIDLASGALVSEGSVKTNGAYDATAGTFATRSAQKGERERLATELAELVATRLLAEAAEGS